jgi:hypothetical protein
VPRITPQSGSWILERLELQSFSGETNLPAIGKQPLAICRYEMRHRVPFPAMAMEPESTVHCEDHPIEAPAELAVRRRGVSCHAGR